MDFPITDVLQMMGRAGRPQYDRHGVAVIMVHEPKKSFYKKFLYEPFPVESSLPSQARPGARRPGARRKRLRAGLWQPERRPGPPGLDAVLRSRAPGSGRRLSAATPGLCWPDQCPTGAVPDRASPAPCGREPAPGLPAPGGERAGGARAQVADHVNAEVVAGSIASAQDAVDYLTWTIFFRRLLQNPSYYDLPATEPAAVSAFLSQLVERTLGELQARPP